MKKALIVTIGIGLAAIGVALAGGGARDRYKVTVDPNSYTLPANLSDPALVVLARTQNGYVYRQWQEEFGDTERTFLLYSLTFNRELLANTAQRLARLEARIAALEPPADPNEPVDPNE